MYKKELDNLIRTGQLPSSILLYGDDYASETYSSFLANKLGDRDNMLKFYYEEYHYESAKSYLSQPSLFGDINLLFIKTDKKIPKKELDFFVDACMKNTTSFFVYEYCGDDKVGRDISRAFAKKKNADFVRFFKPNLSEAVGILSKKAQKIGLEIDSFALQHLFMIQSEDIALAANELEKLLLLDKKIQSNDIDTHVFGMGEVNMDKFIEKLLLKEDMRSEIETLIESGSLDEIRIVNALEAYIVTLMMFRTYITAHGRYDALEILGFPLPQNLVKIRASQSSKISLPIYQQMLTHLLNAEHTLKTSTNLDKNSYLFSTLIKLQTYL
jgi:DNA polymerase-3 subunit delta